MWFDINLPESSTSLNFNPEIVNKLSEISYNPIKIFEYAESIKRDQKSKEILLGIIKTSGSLSSPIISGTALTILSKLDFDFSDLNLENVQIQGAIITGGKFKNTNFKGSNFSGVKINFKLLDSAFADFRVFHSILTSKTSLRAHTGKITCLKFSDDRTVLLSASEDKSVCI